MELSQIFSGLVFLVSAIHMTHTIGSVLWARPSDAVLCREDRPARPRDDWYLFFHCSTLWGTNLHTPKSSQRGCPADSASYPTRATVPTTATGRGCLLNLTGNSLTAQE